MAIELSSKRSFIISTLLCSTPLTLGINTTDTCGGTYCDSAVSCDSGRLRKLLLHVMSFVIVLSRSRSLVLPAGIIEPSGREQRLVQTI